MLPYSAACQGPAVYGPGDSANPCDTHHYWSLHDGGGNWLFGDGSVRFLTYSVSPVLSLLANRGDGAVVSYPGE
jgi:prepilin-type processing-associated H-X9-DG protein